jgi:hypothetical protein
MGTGFKGPFVELWDSVSAIFAQCRETGKSVAVTEQMLPIERYGFLEETFYTWVCQFHSLSDIPEASYKKQAH